MAKKPFISVDGITVGEASALVNVIASNGDITTSNITVSNNANLGAVGNIYIGGGTSGQYLQTNGSGVLTWATVTSGSTSNISNGNSNVNIPAANGNVNISAAGNANILVITGTGVNITGTANVSGNLSAGNITTGGGSGGNISGANVISANILNATLSANLGNSVTANYFIGSGANLTNIPAGNISGQVANALISGTVYTNAQPNITSTGTLVNLTVSGNTALSGANVSLGAVSNLHITGGSANYILQTDGSGNLSWAAAASGSNISNGNSNVNIPSANGNVNISAVGNANVVVVTGTGLVVTGTANVSGNLSAGNITTGGGSGGNISGANNISANTFTGTLTTNAQPNVTSVGTLTSLTVSGNANTGNLGTTALVASGTGSFGGNVNMNNFYINNLGTPSANSDAATKLYVDTLVSSGISYHQPVAVATTTTLATATGGTMTYNNGASGVGANLVTTGTFLNIDSANVQTVGTRILVKDEANAAWNGIYTYANTSTIVRATDADEYGPDSTTQLSINDYFFVQGGVVNEGTAYVVSAPSGTITFGTSNITFAQFSTSQVYDAGTGLTLTNTTFSLSNTAVTSGSYGNGDRVATFTVNGQGQLTAASNTAIAANAANLTGTTLASTIVTSSLTSVGSLTGLTVSNATGIVNLTTTANVTLGAVANLHISGGTSGQYLQTDGSGNLSWATVSSGSTSNISNGNSNVSIATANGNITFSAVGNANIMTITGTGANISGYANVTGNVALSGANVSLGNVSNLHIDGGSNTYVLSTDGAGNLSWTAASGTSIGVDNFTGNGVQTAFTLTSTPANANATLVSIAGTFQPRTVYSLAGNVITFSSAPPNTAPIEVTTFTTGSGGGGGGGITAQDLLSPFLLMGA